RGPVTRALFRQRSTTRQHIADRLGVPSTAAWRGNPPSVQSVSDLMQRRSTRTLYLADHRQHIGSVLISKGLDGRDGTVASLGELRATQGDATVFRSRQSGLGASTDHRSFLFGQSSEQVEDERIDIWA